MRGEEGGDGFGSNGLATQGGMMVSNRKVVVACWSVLIVGLLLPVSECTLWPKEEDVHLSCAETYACLRPQLGGLGLE